MSKFYSIEQRGSGVADVYIFGDITSWPYRPDDKSAGGLVRELQQLEADVINIHIDSFGGSVKEGWGMYNTLKQHKATINTYADGFVASASLYPFLAGQNRYASPASAFFLHEAAMSAHGNAGDLRAAADEIEKITDIGIQAFVDSAGMEEQAVRDLMQRKSWLDPNEALELGLVTSIVRGNPSQNYTQSIRADIIQAMRERETPSVTLENNDKNLFATMFAK